MSMQNHQHEDAIWNRACLQPIRTHLGDRMLSDLLQAHGMVMNGGVLHAAECLSDSELQDALIAFSFYGLEPAAEILSQAKEVTHSDEDPELYEERLDAAYSKVILMTNALSKNSRFSFCQTPPHMHL
jgi:hypothetical protein